ncbi:CRISPR-associated endonuclease Cas2 [uncultured Ruthenibacterium sp.]|uniref:CRISPR-associated endonuclease Cas2 n=1 Tax=uncultured Ruthenibacterium sp. TaxID=1905347 RepID=UPI00349E6D6D
MLVLITYDVNTETAAGRKRLRKVAKACVDHGQRVQNSVFECLLDSAQYAQLKAQLGTLIDPNQDSLRFYRLGNNYKSKVEHLGLSPAWAQDDLLLL